MTVKQLIQNLKEEPKNNEICLLLDLDEIRVKCSGRTKIQVGISTVETSDDWTELILDLE